ncbi:hypothetical protein [Paenibacillus tengchongensis]|uniref:hypothetical protein n=1 Tax=Paenibacillus tengchongensis TaxID=2608684 RepID=UPI00124BFF1A|nr:hypothetical protein [Paenibacillus tengchongensis]
METKQITSSMIEFYKHNVLSITEITRTNKLSEILDSYANKKSGDIYLVQNSRNKDALGAIIDVDLLQELLELRDTISNAADQLVEEMAISRLHAFNPNVTLAQAIHQAGIEDIDVDEIIKLSDEVEI